MDIDGVATDTITGTGWGCHVRRFSFSTSGSPSASTKAEQDPGTSTASETGICSDSFLGGCYTTIAVRFESLSFPIIIVIIILGTLDGSFQEETASHEQLIGFPRSAIIFFALLYECSFDIDDGHTECDD